MNRNDVLSIAVIVILVLAMTSVTVALMPLWLPVILVKPSILNPVQEHITHQIMKRAVRSMVRI